MNAQKLKKSILKYAFEGKLVAQTQDSESSTDLLNIINQEKSALIQQKKSKAEQLNLTVLEQEIPYDIPEKWTWVKLGTITVKIHYGYTASSHPNSGASKLLRITDIQNNNVIWKNVPYCEISEDNISKFCLNEGDILIARTGGTIGKSYLISEIPSEIPAVFASYLIRVQSTSSLYKEYISYYLQSELYWEQLRGMSVGTGQPNVNAQNLKKLLLPFPPLNEQIKIVDKIKELFSKVELYDNCYVELDTLNKRFPKDLEKSILQFAIEGKLVEQDTSDEPPSELLKRISEQKEQMIKEKVIKKEKSLPPITEEEIPFDIPDTWEWVRLKNIGIITSGGTPKTAVSDYWNGNITWITPSDMGKNKNSKYLSTSDRVITSQGLSNSSAQLIPKNSIVYSSRAPIGHINIMTTDYATNQGCKSFSPILVDVEYIYYALKVMTPYLQKKASGTTFKEISGTTFGLSLIPLPPLQEQSRIVKAIEKNKSVLNKLNAALVF